MPEINKRTVALGPPQPPIAVVLIWLPDQSVTQIQWPPQMPLPFVRAMLADCLNTIENMIATQNGGIIKVTGPLPPTPGSGPSTG